MLWLKALHVVFVVTWFAGLFYLPRLYVYHTVTTDAPGRQRFVVMERRLFFIMSVGALLAVLFGMAMILAAPGYLAEQWLRAKLLLVALLIGYHFWCYRLMLALRTGGNSHSQR
jgi:putative membrane protein